MLKVTTHPSPSQTYLGCNDDNLNCLGCVPGNYAQTDGGFQGSEYGGGGLFSSKMVAFEAGNKLGFPWIPANLPENSEKYTLISTARWF